MHFIQRSGAWFKRHWQAASILCTSTLTHFLFFGHPREIVFDEVYFPQFASGYLTHSYFFDVHPPFAKLLFAGFAWLVGANPLGTSLEIGMPMDTHWLIVRLLPMVAGVLLAVVAYYLARQIGISKFASWCAGMSIALENSLIVQSRFILMDSLLVLFGFAGLLFFLVARKRGSVWLRYLSLALLIFAFSTKWTGGTFMLIALVVTCYDTWQKRKEAGGARRVAVAAFQFFVLPLLAYGSFFAVHFALLTKTGPGDAFMSELFQKTLEGNANHYRTDLRHTPFAEKFLELNYVMYDANRRLDATHSYSSKWYTWPLMQRGVFYWQQNVGEKTNEYIYLLGNPAVYWGSLIGLFILALLMLRSLILRERPTKEQRLAGFVFCAYLLNFLPFIFIGRVMFLYHYEAALVFAIIASAVLLDMVPAEHRKQIGFAAVTVVFLLFVHFAPLTYGLPISDDAMPQYFWINSWR